MERRLAAIVAIDVVGYSRLMETDEAGTYAAFNSHREELISPKVAEYRGRIVKLTGDGALVEFPSVVDAVECAAAIQRGMAERNLDVPEDQRIKFRIGINIGDIIVERDDIYGNGVNVAARLETLAEPGGICISGRVFDQVEKNVDLGYAFMGSQEVKNIEKPINAYKVLLDPEDAGNLVRWPKEKSISRPWLIVTLVASVAAAGGGLWIHLERLDFEPAAIANMAYPLPENPSIAVLPFDSYSDDPHLAFLASGLTEDLTAALAKAPDIFVISRNSAASYKGKALDVKKVAEEQGVRYVLEGSVQQAGSKLRITAQLIDAIDGQHLWADRFDREASDLFALQDEIVKQVFVELQVKLTQGDAARVASRGTENLEAWLLRVQSHGEFVTFTREGMVRARALAEAAHQADPYWSRPVAILASVHWYEAKRGWSDSWEESIRLGMELAKRAIEMDPEAPLGYMALGNLLALQGYAERAIAARRKAVKLAPNDFIAVAGLATRLKDLGQPQEAIELFERGMRLSPKHPWWVPSGYALALHLVGRKQEAVEFYKKANAIKPHLATYVRLAALYADLDRVEEARAVADEVLRLEPNFTIAQYMRGHSLHDAQRDAWYKDLLTRAGLPK